MPHRTETCDIAVIGAGHAGCEAALAAARLGFSVMLFTVSIDAVAMMPCNPNIGGTSKGHLVREVDALGGEMGKNIDKTFLQSRMLNTSKGPAVHSLRAQADKQAYTREMRRTLEREPLVRLRQAEVSEILTENGAVTGVRTASGAEYTCRAAVLCSGTYLRSRCVYGDVIEETGPGGLRNARLLTDCLHRLGIRTVRLKTGTPARVDGRTVDISRMEEQRGDDRVVPFSFTTDPESVQKDQVPCYLTYTNEETHRIIRENVDRSPLFSGVIEGKGPRYCPSIEDKVVRFADRPRHQIFVEPEGLYTNELYLSGLSSSLPEDVQAAMIRTIPGLENAEIVRNAYAIEYDALASGQLRHSLELRGVRGLFAAGQFNGSSGYEEAAAQGLMAGINAARMLQGREPVVLTRAQGYIGVLIDDLVTKELTEPYRMMTARAEYRLLLRQDNADQRLTPIGYDIGLISESRMRALEEKTASPEPMRAENARPLFWPRTVLHRPRTASPSRNSCGARNWITKRSHPWTKTALSCPARSGRRRRSRFAMRVTSRASAPPWSGFPRSRSAASRRRRTMLRFAGCARRPRRNWHSTGRRTWDRLRAWTASRRPTLPFF